MLHIIKRIKSSSKQVVEQSLPNMKILGLVGIYGSPIAYLFWTYLEPQTYDNLLLRLLTVVICLPIAFADKLPKFTYPYLALYCVFALTYNFPFLFSFMLFNNDYSLMWQLSLLLSLFLLMFIVSDWILVLFIFLLGTASSFIIYALTVDQIMLPDSPYGLVFVYLFAFIGGSLFNYKTNLINKERLNSMAEVASNIAHELRTPLLGIKSGIAGLERYLPTLFKGYELARKSGQPVDIIRKSHYDNLLQLTERLEGEILHSNTIIDMLLVNTDLSTINQADYQHMSIVNCINNALDRYPFQSEMQKNKINWEPSDDFSVSSIEILIIHVLFNLLKNALYSIQAANKGAIYINIIKGPNYNELRFKDTGEGIAKTHITSIFDRFSTTKSYGIGSGIGLSFCKEVMENLEGKITVNSDEGIFTEFILYFPPSTKPTPKVPTKTLIETKSVVKLN